MGIRKNGGTGWSLWVWRTTATLVSCHLALSIVGCHKSFLDLALFASGGERAPYQYRILTAWILRLFGTAGPVVRVARLLPPPYSDPYSLVQIGMTATGMLISILATRRSLEALSGGWSYSAWASLLVPYFAYFHFALPYGLNFILPYDVPSLCFFSLALYAIIVRNSVAFYATFVVGTLNRETMLFAVVPFAIWQLVDASAAPVPGGRRRAFGHAVAQVTAWLLVRILIVKVFASHAAAGEAAGGLVIFHLKDNLRSVLKPYHWPLLASCFGFLLPLVINYRRLIEDARLRLAVQIVLPAWLAVMLVVGAMLEIRIFAELIALVALAAGLIGRRLPSYLADNHSKLQRQRVATPAVEIDGGPADGDPRAHALP